ncbi:FHA domain-containing protein [Clostridium polynesiense]|uniref:FHA domain-containing protein n=1 Tax=Clostridium polynesiense TaxID=1325933 RepID=UPI00058EA061|nr:FHA domain-containing protein [Clostridium polynesiense]
MSFMKLLSFGFTIIFVVIIYFIIFYALKIMYKDVKTGNKRRSSDSPEYELGLEVLDPGENENLKKGSVVPIRGVISLGRKEDNTIVLTDQYISGHHAKIFVKNREFILEDLDSTNGTILNGSRIYGRVKLEEEDEIKMGSLTFRVIG